MDEESDEGDGEAAADDGTAAALPDLTKMVAMLKEQEAAVAAGRQELDVVNKKIVAATEELTATNKKLVEAEEKLKVSLVRLVLPRTGPGQNSSGQAVLLSG